MTLRNLLIGNDFVAGQKVGLHGRRVVTKSLPQTRDGNF